MNKIIITIVVVVVLGGGLWFLSSQNNENANNTKTTTNSAVTSGGAYVDYSEDGFAAASGQKRVLFFHAGWCPTCQVAHREFNERAGEIPAGVTVFKTDYDTESVLKKKYGITYQHTFVQVDANGNEVAKWNGGSVDQLKKKLK